MIRIAFECFQAFLRTFCASFKELPLKFDLRFREKYVIVNIYECKKKTSVL